MPVTNDLIAGQLAIQPELDINKASVTTEGAGTFQSLWKVAGLPPAGANPPLFTAGAGYTNDDTRLGAWPYTNPSGGATKYMAVADALGTLGGTLIIYDRLWTCSGFGTVVTTAQTITTPGTIPARDANGAALGAGVELWGEVYTAPGATTATWTVGYTNEAGTAGRSATYTHPANAETVGQMFPFILQASDLGVRAPASFTASVSSGTAGDIGLTLLRRIAKIPLVANVATILDWASLGLPRIIDDSCLAMQLLCTTTTSGIILGGHKLVDLTP